MNINEAIIHARQVAEGCGVDSRDCAYQHYKLVGWLEELVAYRTKIPFDRLDEAAALVKARDEGQVVLLPCKPSDVTVYQLRSKKHALGVGISPRHISATTVWANGDYALHHQGAGDCLKKDLGKTWFLTRAEAEAALQEGDTHESN